MAGVINNTARQVDMRGRVPGRHGVEAIRRVTLNPGFNVVPDDDMRLVLANKANTPLIDNKVITVGAMKRREDETAEAEVAKREREVHQMERPDAIASLIPGDKGQRRPGNAAQAEAEDDLAL